MVLLLAVLDFPHFPPATWKFSAVLRSPLVQLAFTWSATCEKPWQFTGSIRLGIFRTAILQSDDVLVGGQQVWEPARKTGKQGGSAH